MAAHQNKDPFSKSQSSNLWRADKQQSNKLFDVPTRHLNIPNGIEPTASPPFASGLERSQWVSPRNVAAKATTGISFSGKSFKPSEKVKSHTPRTPRSLFKKNSQISTIEPEKSSRSASLAKNSSSICRNRRKTIAVVCLFVALCAIAIAIAIVFLRKGSNSTTTSTTSTMTTTSSISTTSATSTTTTNRIPPGTAWIPSNYNTSCSNTCINVSTVTPSTLLASWTFDLQTNDVSGNGNNGQVINGLPNIPISFTTGYIGQAIILPIANLQYVNASYINFTNCSFTVEAWIYLYFLSSYDSSIFGECEKRSPDYCLHLIIRNYNLYMGFYYDDLSGSTTLTTSVWYHVAFVYDYSLNFQYVYLNGLLDGQRQSFSAFLGTSGAVTIGESLSHLPPTYWDGLLDQVTVTNRVKSPFEILNDASLIAHFTFDNNYNDVGPNSMIGTYNPQGNSGLSFISGRVNQSLNFNSWNSYFQSCGFYALGQNQPYSIAMWVQPSYQSGTLFHLSSSAAGSGSWCLPMIGFSLNGSIVVQTWNGSTVSIMGPILPINTWTHIVQTYSSTNGLRLYINGGLYGSAPVNTFLSSSLTMCVLLGSSGLGTNCQTGLISMGSYSGAIDEFYVYNRELSASEVCPLAHP